MHGSARNIVEVRYHLFDAALDEKRSDICLRCYAGERNRLPLSLTDMF